VISDIKTPVASGTVVSYYESVVISSQDYSPFGVTLEGRSWSAGYRYGFNGQEVEDGITGSRTHTSAEFWMYDARLGRRWEMDPFYHELEFTSAYSVNFNSPLIFKDENGDWPILGALIDYAFQVAENYFVNHKTGLDVFTDVDLLSIGANLIPGGKIWMKAIRITSDFFEVRPSGFKQKKLNDVIISKVSTTVAKKVIKRLKKVSSKETLRRAEESLDTHKKNVTDMEKKLIDNPDSKKMKRKLEKRKENLERAKEEFQKTKKRNEELGSLSKEQWDVIEKTTEKTIEQKLKGEQEAQNNKEWKQMPEW
jgi:hypothetical protein